MDRRKLHTETLKRKTPPEIRRGLSAVWALSLWGSAFCLSGLVSRYQAAPGG